MVSRLLQVNQIENNDSGASFEDNANTTNTGKKNILLLYFIGRIVYFLETMVLENARE